MSTPLHVFTDRDEPELRDWGKDVDADGTARMSVDDQQQRMMPVLVFVGMVAVVCAEPSA